MYSIVIEKFNDKEVRALIINDAFWFIAYDFCEALQMTCGSICTKILSVCNIGRKIDHYEKTVEQIYIDDELKNILLFSESGVYKLLYLTDNDISKEFKLWMHETLLPKLRDKLKNDIYKTVKNDNFNFDSLKEEFENIKKRQNILEDLVDKSLIL